MSKYLVVFMIMNSIKNLFLRKIMACHFYDVHNRLEIATINQSICAELFHYIPVKNVCNNFGIKRLNGLNEVVYPSTLCK